MAKTLLQFKSILDRLKGDLAKHDKQADDYDSARSKMYDKFKAGAENIGQCVQKLKNAGHAGNTLRDFLNLPNPDRQLVEANKLVGTFVVAMGQDWAAFKNKVNGEFKGTVASWNEMMTELETEIAVQTKKKDPGVVAFSNLLKGYKTAETEYKYVFRLVKEGPKKVDLEDLKDIIEKEVRNTRISEEAMKLRQMLNLRNLLKWKNKIKILHDAILTDFAKLKVAQQAGKMDQIRTLLKSVGDAKRELESQAQPLEKAVQDFAVELNTDKDGPKVRQEVGEITAWKQDIDRRYQIWSRLGTATGAAKRQSASL